MSAISEQVFIEALAMPARERASLVHKLLVSLESEGYSAEIEAAWEREAMDRCAAYDQGRMSDRDADLMGLK